ncbi:MAG: sigma-70 family RNA polymerase sigma factor [Phycisphaera sp.]|nr:sigma-70 family RNA polymerase sigma factor [Phycisphaera sp.]
MNDTATTQPDPAELTDEQLMALYQQGHEAVFPVIIQRYRRELFNFLVRFLGDKAAAEDVFQEAFLQVHLSADRFDTEKRFKPWLFTIAANKGRDYMRKRVRRRASTLDAPIDSSGDGQSFVDLLEADMPQPDENLAEDELRNRVMQAIGEMPEHLREILLLSYFQQLSYNDIADMLEIPLGTVKSRLHTAVGTFAKKWKKLNPGRESA